MSESSINQIPLGINFLYYMQAQKNGNKSNLVYTNSCLGVWAGFSFRWIWIEQDYSRAM